MNVKVGDKVTVTFSGVVTRLHGGVDEPAVMTLRTEQGYGDDTPADLRFHVSVPLALCEVDVEP